MSDALRRSSYTVDGVTELLGPSAVANLARGRAAVVRDALADDGSHRATLVRLLLLGDEVAVEDVADVLALDDVAPLLSLQRGVARTAYDVGPYADETHDWWVVSDRTDSTGRPARADHVLGVGSASTTLAQLTVRRPARRALDIGTGCGVQALHLTSHAESVTATDVVDRAVTLAATSFALSDVDVELLTGDLEGPVAHREFDLVVCNPPFVVGPAARFAYRDADWSRPATADADGLSRRAVRSAASVLADGGVAQLLVNWLHVRREDWRERVASWVDDLGVDALMLERDAPGAGRLRRDLAGRRRRVRRPRAGRAVAALARRARRRGGRLRLGGAPTRTRPAPRGGGDARAARRPATRRRHRSMAGPAVLAAGQR
jgi:methylase of polypeptide subunit release factors